MRLNINVKRKKFFVSACVRSDANIKSVADYMEGIISAVFALDEAAKISLIPEESNHLGLKLYSLNKDDSKDREAVLDSIEDGTAYRLHIELYSNGNYYIDGDTNNLNVLVASVPQDVEQQEIEKVFKNLLCA